jgi:hypothetical protein
MASENERVCEGKTKRGAMCSNAALLGRPYCVYHDTDLPKGERRPVTKWDVAAGRERDSRVHGRRTPGGA